MFFAKELTSKGFIRYNIYCDHDTYAVELRNEQHYISTYVCNLSWHLSWVDEYPDDIPSEPSRV
jgi:hypothetical protein